MHPVESAEAIVAALLPPRGRWRAAARLAGWALLAAYFLFAAVILALRYWILPNVAGYAGAIEQSVSKALGERVSIGAIAAGWRGLRPDLALSNVTLYDRQGRAALSLPAIDATLAWTSLLYGSLRFHSLAFDRPRLEIRRDESGKFYVAGIELHAERGDAGIGEWVLSQREIAIRGGSVTWDDDLRAAPLLELPAVDLLLRNRGDTHRFALRAKPPAELASALDVRGELNGGGLGDLDAWSGQLYAELEYTDLTAWRRWVDYPFELRSGKGGLRLWLGFAGKKLTEAVGDVALSQVSARVAKDLPLLDLEFLQGRLGARQAAGNAIEVFGRRIALRSGAGVALQPADFSVRWQPGDERSAQQGEAQASALELAPLASLAAYLPFPGNVREQLAAADPRGVIQDVKLAWSGDAENPRQYNVRGRFANLGARAWGRIPGFSGVSGSLDAQDNGGNLSLASEKVAIELPGIVADNRVQFDTLTARLGWKWAPDHLDLSIGNLSFANRDLAGNLFGSFSTRPGARGVIDLTGNFSRADGASVYRYVPFLPERVAEFLKSAILGGRSNDVRLRFKGNLQNFPFESPGLGTFQVVAKVNEAKLRFAESWPPVNDISGELIFDGKGMSVVASRASVLGVRASHVRANIADLFHGNEQLQVEVQAEDQTADFLNFIEHSPVTRFLDGFTAGVRASGSGRLQLKLDIPIRRLDQVRVAGAYQFNNDQIRLDAELPPFSQVNGRLEFTEGGVTARSINAQFLGGPALISVATRGDGNIVASAQGTAGVGQLPRAWGGPILRRATGSAAWRASLSGARKRPVTLVVESQLAGIAVDLPPPLGKSASEALPLRIERVIEADSGAAGGRRADTIKMSLGRDIGGQFQRRREGDRFEVERGVLSFGEPPVMPERAGIAVTGSLPYVDLDRWRALLSGEDSGGSVLSSLNLRVAALDFGGRRLNDLSVRAGTSGSVWVANVAAKELAGEIAWRPEGRGRIVARLKQLTVPGAAPRPADSGTALRDLPALDIVADDLILRDIHLGRLELVALNEEGRDWRIQKLVLASPESTLSADGVWQSWAARPSISANIKVEVKDVGKYLERIGYPRSLQRGSARLDGKFGWAGSPQAVDYPTLTGNLTLTASKGQFLKVEPGVAKLLGILSLQSWVTLDFRELFGEGFAFDSLSSTATITKGVLTTRDFQMRGPSAQVSMSGDIDLARETQNLRVKVVPALGAGVSSIVAILMAHPVFGLGGLVVDKILKDPLGQIFAVDYAVTGTWAEPRAERIHVEASAAGGPSKEAPR